jgi:hypothetical protein
MLLHTPTVTYLFKNAQRLMCHRTTNYIHTRTRRREQNWNSSNKQAVAIRMDAKIRPIAIRTAGINMNVLPIGGLNIPETIKSNLQAQYVTITFKHCICTPISKILNITNTY